eukprot:263139_1
MSIGSSPKYTHKTAPYTYNHSNIFKNIPIQTNIAQHETSIRNYETSLTYAHTNNFNRCKSTITQYSNNATDTSHSILKQKEFHGWNGQSTIYQCVNNGI